jgi:hypothetical protein
MTALTERDVVASIPRGVWIGGETRCCPPRLGMVLRPTVGLD